MAPNIPITESDYAAIKLHNDKLADGAKKALNTLRRIPRYERTDIENGMVDWQIRVMQVLNWSTKVAAQRARISDNGRTRVEP